MAKSGRQYADDVRELRSAGVEFPSASSGYILRDAANWSSGQKAAVTRAINRLRKRRRIPEEDFEGISEIEAGQFFDDAAGDAFEEYDDIDFFDFDEVDEFTDEESDQYEEVT